MCLIYCKMMGNFIRMQGTGNGHKIRQTSGKVRRWYDKINIIETQCVSKSCCICEIRDFVFGYIDILVESRVCQLICRMYLFTRHSLC